MTSSTPHLDPSQLISALVDSGRDKVMDHDDPAQQTQEELRQIRETILKIESDFTIIQDFIRGVDNTKVILYAHGAYAPQWAQIHAAYTSVIHGFQVFAKQLTVDLTCLIEVIVPLFKNDDIGEAQKNRVIDRYIESFSASTQNIHKPGTEFLRIQGDVQAFHEQITKAVTSDLPTPRNQQGIEDVRRDLINLQMVFNDLTARLSTIGNIWPMLIVDAGSLDYDLRDFEGKSAHSAAIFEARANSAREVCKALAAALDLDVQA